MNNRLQELMSFLSTNQGLTLTSILSVTDATAWKQTKHVILSTTPFLTLEMAVNRVSNNRKRNSIPEPQLIYEAIKYASLKRKQYIKCFDESIEEKNNAA